jgi:prepilin-type processing-associated H-X9-DG protein
MLNQFDVLSIAADSDIVTNLWPQGHGPNSFTVLFVDGHAKYTDWRRWNVDPALTADDDAEDWSGMTWADFQ